MEAREYVTLMNSASKRALFPNSKNVMPAKSDDEDSLGHMSPLKDSMGYISSPDRYSSAPCSPCWVAETPTKTLGIDKETVDRKQTLLRACQTLKSFTELTPQKAGDNIIIDTPVKENEYDVLSPFKCLTQLSNNNDTSEKYEKLITPSREFKRKRNIEETPDSIVSKSDTVKNIVWKRKLQTKSPNAKRDVLNNLDFNNSVFSIIRNSFYKPSETKAKISLFSDYLPAKKPNNIPKPHKARNPNATYPGSYSRKLHKRRIAPGEINAGVHHKIRRPKLKKVKGSKPRKSTEVPRISPEQRVEHYVVNSKLLEKGNSPLKESNGKMDGHNNISLNVNNKQLAPTIDKDSDVESICSEEEPVPDPQKKFFKTNRTLAINHRAIVTLGNNVKIKVHKGKMTLDTLPKKRIQFKKKKSVLQEKLFDEDQVPHKDIEQVKESVEVAIQKLTEELETPQDFDNSHIQSITSSTSSLALEDNKDLNSRELANKEKENERIERVEGGISNSSDNSEYFPVFYKRKGLYDSTNTQKKISPPLKKMRPLDENQYQIDAGQSRFRAVNCKECDTLYHLGDPDDEIAHYYIHNHISTFRFTGWKNERVVKIYPDGGRVLVVYPDDPKPWVNKIKDVLDAVDEELGFVEGNVTGIDGQKVYLYILKNRIIGVLCAKFITEAFKMLDTGCDGPDCCSDETYPVKGGVSRIWVVHDRRRKRVATSLLNCMRLTFMFDHILAKHEIAFSVPTDQGKAFAVNYMQTREFMVFYK